ncbi:type III secretion apparatus assembly chaperone SctY [Alcaligenes sp. Marseille-Q7550]
MTFSSPDAPPLPSKGKLGENGGMLLDLLAYVYLENDRPEKAAALLEALETLELADARRRTALAWAQLRCGKPSAALDTLNQAALQGETGVAFHLVRAQTLVALDRIAEAKAAMQAYINLRANGQDAPDSPSI